MNGKVFSIQKYSLNDGDGIRTIIFFQGCPLRCAWCSNPESLAVIPPLLFSPEKCIACAMCISACPSGAMKTIGKIDRRKCSSCGKCAEDCPSEALEMKCRSYSVAELVDEVEKDRMFYLTSSGGITFSGGEPYLQYKFMKYFSDSLKKKGFHIAIETTGYTKWEHIEHSVDNIDLFLYDLKTMDDEVHKKHTSVSNKTILANLRKLGEMNKRIIIRIPLLGGVNDDKENIIRSANKAIEVGAEAVHLLPYHEFGKIKYERIGEVYMCDAVTPSDAKIEKLKKMIENMGIPCIVRG